MPSGNEALQNPIVQSIVGPPALASMSSLGTLMMPACLSMGAETGDMAYCTGGIES